MLRRILRLPGAAQIAALGLAAVLFPGYGPVQAAEPLEAHLQAGEFGPALAAAAAETRADRRDELLGKIAAAQAAAGAAQASIGTAGEIGSDLARKEALGGVQKQGGFFGGGGGVQADFD